MIRSPFDVSLLGRPLGISRAGFERLVGHRYMPPVLPATASVAKPAARPTQSDAERRRVERRVAAAMARIRATARPPADAYRATLSGEIGVVGQKRARDARIPGITPDVVARHLRFAGDRPVLFSIDTIGGTIDSAKQIANLFLAHRPGIYAHVGRRCHSAGLLLLAAAGHRAADSCAEFVFHPAAIGIEDAEARSTARALRFRASALEDADRAFNEFLSRRTGASLEAIERISARDRKCSAAEVHKLGLLHAVLPASAYR